MSWRLPLALLVGTALALSGCASDGSGTGDRDGAGNPPTTAGAVPNGTANETAPVPQLLQAHGCGLHLGAFPFPMDQARASVPEGYEPTSFTGTGQFGTLVALGVSCQTINGTALNGTTVSDHLEMLAMVPVDPPSAVAGEADAHYVHFGGFVPDDAVRSVLNAWGLPWASPGDVTFSETTPGGGTRIGDDEGSDSQFTIQMRTAVPAETTLIDGFVLRLYGYANETVTGAMDFHIEPSNYTEGAASVAAPPTPSQDPMAVLFNLLGTSSGIGVHQDWGEGLAWWIEPVDLQAEG